MRLVSWLVSWLVVSRGSRWLVQDVGVQGCVSFVLWVLFQASKLLRGAVNSARNSRRNQEQMIVLFKSHANKAYGNWVAKCLNP